MYTFYHSEWYFRSTIVKIKCKEKHNKCTFQGRGSKTQTR